MRLRIENLRVYRDNDSRATPTLDAVSLDIASGEHVALVGANGAGKTSLLLALVGAVPFEGRVRYDNTDLAVGTLGKLRQELGFVFADPSDQFFCETVFEEVAFGARHRGKNADEVAARVERALARVGLTGMERRSPFSLSLGEQRRLAMASALALDARVLLFDEPTASLDPIARRDILSTLRDTPGTLLVAAHDLDAVLTLGMRVIVLARGGVMADGKSAEILSDEALLERAGLALPISVEARRASG